MAADAAVPIPTDSVLKAAKPAALRVGPARRLQMVEPI
jgi:hypothetical protein